MRLLREFSDEEMDEVRIYLSPAEAKKLIGELGALMTDPEAGEHFHLFSEDGGPSFSLSIVTKSKLDQPGYTPAERRAFREWMPRE